MKLSPKAKKWGKRILILLLIRFVVGGILYYVIVYRFKDIMQVVVRKESKGAYAFDASDVEVSLFKKKLVLRNAALTCKDTLRAAAHYDVRIPEVYLKISSWTDLIFHKKVEVDSLAIIMPHVMTHQHRHHEKRQVSFHATEIFNGLHKALKHLQVRSFSLQNGAFTYGIVNHTSTFDSRNINFSVRNFSKQHEADHHLFASDDVQLQLDNQHWTFPSGNADLSFRRLYFSAATETFHLDSCTFRSLDSTKPKMSVSAETLFFNSRQLADIYEKEELIIDTLLLVRPVLHLQTSEHKKAKDSAHISSAFEKMFEGISLKYVDIKEGKLLLYKKDENVPVYATEKTDLRVYNLNMKPKTAQLTTHSIQLSLHNIRLVTRDSLFEMRVRDFEFRQNELLFKNVSYGPTQHNHNAEGIRFETPLLHLKNIDLAALLEKKIRGTEAILHRPEIVVFSKGKKKQQHHKKTSYHFYQTLHGLGELVAVDDFRIVEGHLRFHANDSGNTRMEMKGINASILLRRFFASDSLIDIKRAMPDLRVDEMRLESPKVKLLVDKYHFEGAVRHNAAEKFSLSLSNGTELAGRKLYWQIFDWDQFSNHGIIQVEHIDVRELDVQTVKQEHHDHHAKDLPVISIRRVDIGKMNFERADGGLTFNANNICVDDIGSQTKYLFWKNASAQIADIVFANKNIKTAVGIVQFTNEGESVLKDILVAVHNEKANIDLRFPAIKLHMPLHSSDFSAVHLDSLIVDEPATVQVKSDSMSLAAKLKVKAVAVKNIVAEKKVLLNSLAVELSGLSFRKKDIGVDIAKTSLKVSNGILTKANGGMVLHAAVAAAWSGADFITERKNGLKLTVNNMSGRFEQQDFSMEPGSKLNPQTLAMHTWIDEGKVNLNTQKLKADIGSINWNPAGRRLRFEEFSMVPHLSMEESFEKAAWQNDYITVQGKELTISGIKKDSAWMIGKILANGLLLTTTRDKRKPFKGMEKLMPAHLISTVKHPFHIDSVVVQNSEVTVREISAATDEMGSIPLKNLDVLITGISNMPGAVDSLELHASAVLLNSNIRHFYYREAYGDSLSNFEAGVYAAPMPLTPYSSITIPLAAVNVSAGRADTLFASWSGNKHGAIGTMNFYYEGLKVELLDKHNHKRKNFILSVENWLANSLVLKKKNRDDSRIFFMRNKEKFVFNYWIKTIMTGMMSSVGIKSDRKYLKHYRKEREKYALPEE